eukprot:4693654-Pyramimonas_sp.AAC.1
MDQKTGDEGATFLAGYNVDTPTPASVSQSVAIAAGKPGATGAAAGNPDAAGTAAGKPDAAGVAARKPDVEM